MCDTRTDGDVVSTGCRRYSVIACVGGFPRRTIYTRRRRRRTHRGIGGGGGAAAHARRRTRYGSGGCGGGGDSSWCGTRVGSLPSRHRWTVLVLVVPPHGVTGSIPETCARLTVNASQNSGCKRQLLAVGSAYNFFSSPNGKKSRVDGSRISAIAFRSDIYIIYRYPFTWPVAVITNCWIMINDIRRRIRNRRVIL